MRFASRRKIARLIVSIHASVQGCDSRQVENRLTTLFQYTHPYKDAIAFIDTLTFSGMFQYTHPCKDAMTALLKQITDMLFQYTHPYKDAMARHPPGQASACFNTRIHTRMR